MGTIACRFWDIRGENVLLFWDIRGENVLLRWDIRGEEEPPVVVLLDILGEVAKWWDILVLLLLLLLRLFNLLITAWARYT